MSSGSRRWWMPALLVLLARVSLAAPPSATASADSAHCPPRPRSRVYRVAQAERLEELEGERLPDPYPVRSLTARWRQPMERRGLVPIPLSAQRATPWRMMDALTSESPDVL